MGPWLIVAVALYASVYFAVPGRESYPRRDGWQTVVCPTAKQQKGRHQIKWLCACVFVLCTCSRMNGTCDWPKSLHHLQSRPFEVPPL